MDALKKQNEEHEEVCSDLKEVKSVLNTHKSEEIDKITQQCLDNCLKYHKTNPKDQVVSFLMDSMNQFIAGSA